MGNFLKAPLLWFVLTGIALFVIDSHNQNNNNQSIRISQGDIQRVRDQWQAQSGKPVTADMLDALLQEQIQERRLYREALALGLDKNDVIVRRRLAQKLRFLTEDLPGNQNRYDGELEAYFDRNRHDYVRPAEVSFKHIYFNTDRSIESDINSTYLRIQEVLSLLKTQNTSPSETDSWQRMGNIFMLGRNFPNYTMVQVSQQFGSEFADRLTTFESSSWVGPISSPFGLHLVYIDQYRASTARSFVEARAQVEMDYRAEQRDDNFNRYLESLATKYPVIIEPASDNVPLTINSQSK